MAVSKQSLSNSHIFSISHIITFLSLGRLDSTLTLPWGGHWKQQNQTPKKQTRNVTGNEAPSVVHIHNNSKTRRTITAKNKDN